MRMKKQIVGLGLALGLSGAMAMTAFAGQWKQDAARPANQNGISNWWYQNDDGSYPAGNWFWIDGNGDGLAESYRFDGSGWMYASTSVDGYMVDGSGAWLQNGVVSRKSMSAGKTGHGTNTNDTSSNGTGSGSGNGTGGESSNGSGNGSNDTSADSTVKNQWVSDSYGKRYYDSKGKLTTGWKKISSKQYYFDESGYALTGYQEADGNEYYILSDGTLATKTVHDSAEGVYYVVDKSEHYVVDVVDESDWKEYKKDADKTSVDISNVTNTENEKDTTAAGSGSSLTDEEAYKKIIALKKDYPEGKKWNNSNSFQRGYTTGYGCAGFVFLVQNKVFGANASFTRVDSLDWDELRVGDHIRMYNGAGGEHSVIVLTIEDDYITITEGNYNSSIHWGRKITMDDLEDEFIYRETYYE